MSDLLAYTDWGSVKDGGERTLLSAFLNGEEITADHPAAQGVGNLDQFVATRTMHGGLGFHSSSETVSGPEGTADFQNASYRLKAESLPKVAVLLGRDLPPVEAESPGEGEGA